MPGAQNHSKNIVFSVNDYESRIKRQWVTFTNDKSIGYYSSKEIFNSKSMCLPRVELGSIARKAIILIVGLQTLLNIERTKPTIVKQIQGECNYN